MKLPTVFIASSTENLDFAKKLQFYVSKYAEVKVWTEGLFNPGFSIVETLINIAENTDLAVFLLGPDDFKKSRSERELEIRQNILFELGLFFGKLGSSRIILSVPEEKRMKLPSDLVGLMCHTTKEMGSNRSVDDLVYVIRRTLEEVTETDEAKNKSANIKQYYSCFISYSAKDKEFVYNLYNDLTEIGVPCWLDSMEMRIGEDIKSSLHRSIQEQDRIILILSQNSIKSKWISRELSVSLDLEKKRGKTILFPIRIDDSVFKQPLSSPLDSITNRHIGDFTNWKNKSNYKKSFSHMVRDLMTVSSAESKGGV